MGVRYNEAMKYNPAIHLRSIGIQKFGTQPQGFPFNVPIIQSLESLEFSSQVTFFVGENGCGKSTLLETIACAAGSITVGSESVETDRTLASVRLLSKSLKLTWSKRTRRGFFMRSEDFFGYARKMTSTRVELQQNLDDIERDYQGRSEWAKRYARMPYASEIGAMKRDYGDDLDAHSHGESYLKLFQTRFVPGGLYLLDEPEAPLSPLRQLSFLAVLKGMVDQEAQFLIATHSPILMAFPDAEILNCDGGKIEKAAYNDLEHVRITRSFLNNPESYLRHLWE
jgi:predicted ATPase